MDTTTRKCIIWAVACFVIAAGLYMIWPIFVASESDPPGGSNFFFGIVQPVLSFIQGVLVSIGGALVGAAVVVHWLTSRVSVTKGPLNQLS